MAHLTVAEVARRLGLSRSFAYRLVRSSIGYVQHGRAIRVPVERLERYVAASAVAPIAPTSHTTVAAPLPFSSLAPLVKPIFPRTKPRAPSTKV